MGRKIPMTAADGPVFSAHLAEPTGNPRGGIGEKDTHIPLSAVEEIRAAYPRSIYHLYPAEHGFDCTDRASFDAQSAKLAFDRSVDFFRQNIG